MDEALVPELRCAAGCGPLSPIVTIEASGVDHDHHPEQGTTQVIVCMQSCPKCHAGMYWCYDHDCTGWPTSASFPIEGRWTRSTTADDVERLREGLRDCPDTVTGNCRCPAHQALLASQGSLRHWMSRPAPVAAAVVLVDGLPELRPVVRG
jgi:hypothetical protein